MNLNKLFLRWIAVFGMVMVFTVSAMGDTLPQTDDFNTSIDGWGGTANVTWNSAGKRLFIDRDDIASKTYDFGVENANKIVSITLKATEIGTWESDDDIEIRVDGTNDGYKIIDDTVDGSNETYNFSAVLDKNGQLKMTIIPNTDDNSEDVYIEIITISASNNTYSKNYTPDFFLRKQLYAKGNMKMIGNTVLVAPRDNGETGSASSNNGNANCSTYTNGNFIEDATDTNDEYTLCGYSVDGTQTNATRSELNISKSAKILWAGLYWQALIKTDDFSTSQTIKIRNDLNGTNSYKSISPDRLYYVDSGYSSTTSYSAFKDVTSLFTSNGWVDGNYTVAGIPVYEGKLSDLGTYGAWSLVVIYEDSSSTEQYRSFSVFDGWDRVSSSKDVTIRPAGFYTPNRFLTASEAQVSLFTAEGDKNIVGDKLETKNYRDNTPVVLPELSTNTFTSKISGGGSRTPNAANNQGIDIQTHEIGDLLEKKQTEMDFTLTSTGDVYWPSVIAFSTVLVAPELCYDYSFKQDGVYLNADNNGSQLPLLQGYISDSPIEVAIYLRNNEADIKAQGVSFYTDLNATVFNYINGTTQTSNVNSSQYIPRSDQVGICNYDDPETTPIGCSSVANIRIGMGDGATGYSQNGAGELGDKDFVYAKFNIDPIGINGVQEVNQSLGLKLNYYIVPKTGASPIPYDYAFGTDIAMCPPADGYTPVWGIFNVVDHNANIVNGLPANNLRTQVSRKPFAVDVATYEKNTDGKYTKVPTIDMNTTVMVEMIQIGGFHDINSTCFDPGRSISTPVFVKIGNTSTDMTIPVPVQNNAYYNVAAKNAAFRIWYFEQNQTLIDWTATTSDATRLNLNNISGLYKSSYHTLCTTECSSPTSTTCFNCISANYAKPLCSRDNFAIRPESYDLRIYDINQTIPKTNPMKDLTKIDLSTQYNYTPNYPTALGRINIAAGYNYRFDMNATGNDTNLSKVPGYTRYFMGANPEYNATMMWAPKVGQVTTGCNDRSGKSFNFYVANGQMTNTEQNQSQVGDYQLNVIDLEWTAADWYSSMLGHHTTSNGFEFTKEDCVVGSTSTMTVDGKVGCVTSSQHSGGGYTYKDHLLTMKPAKFDLNSIIYGVGKTPVLIGEGGEGFVYKSDLGVNNDMAMAVRSSGAIKAVGYGGEVLSNFVKECYSVDLNLTIAHDANTSLPFIGRMTVAETNGTQIYDSLKFDVNGSMVQVIEDTYFGKAGNGQAIPTIRLNFDRNATTPTLPQIVRYFDLNVSCLEASDCNMSAAFNITPNTAVGSDLMDFNVTHVYGRLVPRDVRVTFGNDFETLAYYEVYKTPILLGTGLLSDTFDSDWRVNSLHTDANYGDTNVTIVIPTSGSSLPVHSTSVGGMETYDFDAFSVRQGYRAHIDTEGWLWYGGISALVYSDPANPGNLNCSTHPCFNISFGRIIGNTGSAKTESETQKANKNTSSGTGWRSTSEYAPAVQ